MSSSYRPGRGAAADQSTRSTSARRRATLAGAGLLTAGLLAAGLLVALLLTAGFADRSLIAAAPTAGPSLTARPNGSPSFGRPPEPLAVFAASSLVPLFGEIEQMFEPAGLPVLTHFAGSHYLAAQIRAGAPADLIITADLDHALRLHEASNLTSAPVELFSNRLVLATIASPEQPTPAASAADTLLDRIRSGGRLLVADPAVPLGGYTQRWFAASVEREEMTPVELAEIRRGIVSYEESARMVIAKLSLGAADLAIVYASDAHSVANEPGLSGRLKLTPLRLDRDPRYYGAVLFSSTRQVRADALLDWLAGPEAGEVAERFGFTRSHYHASR